MPGLAHKNLVIESRRKIAAGLIGNKSKLWTIKQLLNSTTAVMGWAWALWTVYNVLGNLKSESSSIPTAPNHGIYQSRQCICWSTATKKL